MVGGSGYFLGPFLGAAVSVLLPEWMRFGSEGLYLILYAIAVMVLMAFRSDGRRLGLFPRPVPRRRGLGAAAGVDALRQRGAVPDPVRDRRDGADGVQIGWSAARAISSARSSAPRSRCCCRSGCASAARGCT